MIEINRKNTRIWSLLGMRRVLGMMLCELASVDETFMFVTSDVGRYFGVDEFKNMYPDRYIDVGIAEQNMVNVAAGLQKEGMNVIAATYATFITARTLDQIRVSMGYMKLPIILVGVGAGLAEGDLSATHMGLEDVAVMRTIPNIKIFEPADGTELVNMLINSRDHSSPMYIRLTGRTGTPMIYRSGYDFKLGLPNVLKIGTAKSAVFSAGVITDTVLKATELLEEKYGVSVEVVDFHSIKPLDGDFLDKYIDYNQIIVVEEHMITGGLGSAISEYFANRVNRPRITVLGVDDYYPNANDYEMLLSECGLSTEGIMDKIYDYL